MNNKYQERSANLCEARNRILPRHLPLSSNKFILDSDKAVDPYVRVAFCFMDLSKKTKGVSFSQLSLRKLRLCPWDLCTMALRRAPQKMVKMTFCSHSFFSEIHSTDSKVTLKGDSKHDLTLSWMKYLVLTQGYEIQTAFPLCPKGLTELCWKSFS